MKFEIHAVRAPGNLSHREGRERAFLRGQLLTLIGSLLILTVHMFHQANEIQNISSDSRPLGRLAAGARRQRGGSTFEPAVCGGMVRCRVGAFTAAARSIGSRYADVSTRRPHLVASATASGIIFSADVTCQLTLQRDAKNGIDWRRTGGLTVFAAWHYGVPGKYLYLAYDRVLGVTPTLRTAVLKMLFDVYVHGAILVVPSFYMITNTIKGYSPTQIADQLRREWWDAAFGTCLFWTPLCFINFRFIPQHSRILFVSIGSFAHKMWMSWLSNRERHHARLATGMTACAVAAAA